MDARAAREAAMAANNPPADGAVANDTASDNSTAAAVTPNEMTEEELNRAQFGVPDSTADAASDAAPTQVEPSPAAESESAIALAALQVGGITLYTLCCLLSPFPQETLKARRKRALEAVDASEKEEISSAEAKAKADKAAIEQIVRSQASDRRS
jgi:hypothetical protein